MKMCVSTVKFVLDGYHPIDAKVAYLNRCASAIAWITLLSGALILQGQAFGAQQNPGLIHPDKGVVPGTGQWIENVGDDFEDPEWKCDLHLPKSSQEIDKQVRSPGAVVSNGRWYEGVKRGVPDTVQRVVTPEGGLEGSRGALLLRSLQTGAPGRLSHQNQQDDFICDVQRRLGGTLPVHQCPNVVVRVHLPPLEDWGNRAGAAFGFRLSLTTTVRKASTGFGRNLGTSKTVEPYWPGMFADLTPASQSKSGQNEYRWRIRSDQRGYDFYGPEITQGGWWTLGMSVTPDGRVHYYAKQGVEPLTLDDHVVSQFPYGFRAEQFKTFFFNVINGDDGRNWSIPVVVDDCHVYFIDPKQSRVASDSNEAGSARR